MFGLGKQKKEAAVIHAVVSKVRPLFAILELRLGALPLALTEDPYVIGYIVGMSSIFAQIEAGGNISTELRGLVSLAGVQAAFASLNFNIHQASASMHKMNGSAEGKRGWHSADLVITLAMGRTDMDSEPEIVAARKSAAEMPQSIRSMLGGTDASVVLHELQEALLFRPIEAKFGIH